jgi:EAL and modified HD-GYP domain-containing signal transduction protein
MSAPHDAVYLGRQPILDRQRRIVAYELLFRAGQRAEADVTDDTAATAHVVQTAFQHIGIRTVLGPCVGFINVDAPTLLGGTIEQLPREKVLIELLETIEIDAAVVSRCRDLKSKGYRLALDDFYRYSDAFSPLLALVDVVKVDISLLDAGALRRLVADLKLWPTTLLAEKVETPDQARECVALGFRLFQGFLFARPDLLRA